MKKLFTVMFLTIVLVNPAFSKTLEEAKTELLDNTIKRSYWVYVAVEDKSNEATSIEKVSGLANKGDVVVIIPAVEGQEPTPKEKALFLIIVADLTDLEKERLELPYWGIWII